MFWGRAVEIFFEVDCSLFVLFQKCQIGKHEMWKVVRRGQRFAVGFSGNSQLVCHLVSQPFCSRTIGIRA